jgi:hypothetical protein
VAQPFWPDQTVLQRFFLFWFARLKRALFSLGRFLVSGSGSSATGRLPPCAATPDPPLRHVVAGAEAAAVAGLDLERPQGRGGGGGGAPGGGGGGVRVQCARARPGGGRSASPENLHLRHAALRWGGWRVGETAAPAAVSLAARSRRSCDLPDCDLDTLRPTGDGRRRPHDPHRPPRKGRRHDTGSFLTTKQLRKKKKRRKRTRKKFGTDATVVFDAKPTRSFLRRDRGLRKPGHETRKEKLTEQKKD